MSKFMELSIFVYMFGAPIIFAIMLAVFGIWALATKRSRRRYEYDRIKSMWGEEEAIRRVGRLK